VGGHTSIILIKIYAVQQLVLCTSQLLPYGHVTFQQPPARTRAQRPGRASLRHPGYRAGCCTAYCALGPEPAHLGAEDPEADSDLMAAVLC
jgi:hypothetical protein